MARGQKECPQCKRPSGPRKKICDCGHQFVFKVNKIATIAAIKGNVLSFWNDIPGEETSADLIMIPGKSPTFQKDRPEGPVCPIKCSDKSDEGIVAWLKKICQYKLPGTGKARTVKYSKSAIRRFIHELFYKDPQRGFAALQLMDKYIKPYKKEIIAGYETDLQKWYLWKQGILKTPL